MIQYIKMIQPYEIVKIMLTFPCQFLYITTFIIFNPHVFIVPIYLKKKKKFINFQQHNFHYENFTNIFFIFIFSSKMNTAAITSFKIK